MATKEVLAMAIVDGGDVRASGGGGDDRGLMVESLEGKRWRR